MSVPRNNSGNDEIKLSQATSPLPPTTCRRGVRELLQKKFIFRSPYDGLFFVNIRFMFNGDRLANVVPIRQFVSTSQLPDTLTGKDGKPIVRPQEWIHP